MYRVAGCICLQKVASESLNHRLLYVTQNRPTPFAVRAPIDTSCFETALRWCVWSANSHTIAASFDHFYLSLWGRGTIRQNEVHDWVSTVATVSQPYTDISSDLPILFPYPRIYPGELIWRQIALKKAY